MTRLGGIRHARVEKSLSEGVRLAIRRPPRLRIKAAGGGAFFSGDLTMPVPAGQALLVQFRAWPDLYESYEQALAWGGGEVLAGVSGVFPAIPPDLIVELPIRTGPLWVSVVPEPAMLSLAAGGVAVFLALTRRRKAIALAGRS